VIASAIKLTGKPSPMSISAVVLIGAGLFFLIRDPDPRQVSAQPCDPTDQACVPTSDAFAPAPTPPVFSAQEACRGVGYLCADLEEAAEIRIQRWTNQEGTLVVHVPRPDIEEIGVAIRLQNAAAAGIRAWNGQPFQIQVDERGDLDAHFSVTWTLSLSGAQIGVTRMGWSPQRGLVVRSIELTTRSPFSSTQVIDPRQIRLTAAHEMGHALGLSHSDSRTDVMYPTNTSTSLSAQDYRTMEALYSLENGTVIRR